ncbi:MAG: transaldolase family protein, partial [Cyanobacteria bacterium J06632_3]
MSLLDQLKTMTTVVADTGDIGAIEQFTPQDATTNPSLITAAAKLPQYQSIVDETLEQAKQTLGDNASDQDVAKEAFKHLAVAFGKRILDIIPGRVSTEVDARLSYDTEGTIQTARELIGEYEAILIKMRSRLIPEASY